MSEFCPMTGKHHGPWLCVQCGWSPLSPPPAQPVGEACRSCGRGPGVALTNDGLCKYCVAVGIPPVPRLYTRTEVDAEIAAVVERAVQACEVEESARLEAEAKEEGCEDECLTYASHVGHCIEARIRSLATNPQRAALAAVVGAAYEVVATHLTGILPSIVENDRLRAFVRSLTPASALAALARVREEGRARGRAEEHARAIEAATQLANERLAVVKAQWEAALASARQEGAEREREECADVAAQYRAENAEPPSDPNSLDDGRQWNPEPMLRGRSRKVASDIEARIRARGRKEAT